MCEGGQGCVRTGKGRGGEGEERVRAGRGGEGREGERKQGRGGEKGRENWAVGKLCFTLGLITLPYKPFAVAKI